jgi:ketosteroid isomerase-like protein
VSANLDLVRSIYAAWERGDFSSAEWAHPDIEWVFADGPIPGRWTGADGIAAGFRQWSEAWKDFRIEADEFMEVDADTVLVFVHCHGRGKASGIEVGQMHDKTAAVFHLHGGKVTKYVSYWNRDRALAGLGLARETEARRIRRTSTSCARSARTGNAASMARPTGRTRRSRL